MMEGGQYDTEYDMAGRGAPAKSMLRVSFVYRDGLSTLTTSQFSILESAFKWTAIPSLIPSYYTSRFLRKDLSSMPSPALYG